MPDRFNALRIQPPPEMRTNMLAGPPQPDWAGATDENIRLYNDWIARDRQRQIELGNVDPATGQFTPQGWRAQAQTVAGGFGPADIGAMGIGAIKTYHGSPHLFEPTPKNPLGEFRLDKIGTGEGSQAFGHGPYVAESEGLATHYRDLTAGQSGRFEWNGKEVPEGRAFWDIVNSVSKDDWRLGKIVEQAGKYGPRDALNTYEPHTRNASDGAEWQAAMDKFKQGAGGSATGHLYEVNLNAEPGDFLHWDKKLADQPTGAAAIDAYEQAIRSQLAAKGFSDAWIDSALKNPSFALPANATGAQLHAALSKQLGGDVAAATALRDAGVPGVRYLNRNSRGGDPDSPDASHNYAVFDPDKMEIIRRYGIAGLIGGGAAATAAGQDQGNQ